MAIGRCTAAVSAVVVVAKSAAEAMPKRLGGQRDNTGGKLHQTRSLSVAAAAALALVAVLQPQPQPQRQRQRSFGPQVPPTRLVSWDPHRQSAAFDNAAVYPAAPICRSLQPSICGAASLLDADASG